MRKASKFNQRNKQTKKKNGNLKRNKCQSTLACMIISEFLKALKITFLKNVFLLLFNSYVLRYFLCYSFVLFKIFHYFNFNFIFFNFCIFLINVVFVYHFFLHSFVLFCSVNFSIVHSKYFTFLS